MQDPLKQFMDKNRAAFDDQEPPRNGWESLSKKLPREPRSYLRIRRFIAVAAAVLLLFGFGAITGIYFAKNDPQMVKESPVINESPEVEEYKETEAYYSSLVNQKMGELKNYQRDAATNNDIAELEAAFGEWKEELAPTITDEEVMGIMVQHYQRKIEILEKTINKISITKGQPERL